MPANLDVNEIEAYMVQPNVFDAMVAVLQDLPAKSSRALLNEIEKTTRIIKKAKVESSEPVVSNADSDGAAV